MNINDFSAFIGILFGHRVFALLSDLFIHLNNVAITICFCAYTPGAHEYYYIQRQMHAISVACSVILTKFHLSA